MELSFILTYTHKMNEQQYTFCRNLQSDAHFNDSSVA